MTHRPGHIAAPDAARWNALRNRAKTTAEPRNWFRISNLYAENGDTGDTAIVDIYDEIGGWGVDAAQFVAELRSITTPKIELHVNSPGGDFYAGLGIYNALIDHPATITAYVDALAASAASVIIEAADRVVMGRNAEVMVHDAWGYCCGNAADMIEMADMLGKVSDNIASIYSARAGNGNVAAWRKRMAAETWYSAQEAVDIGLADEVSKTEKRSGESEPVAAKWDLSIFAHSCRAEAPDPEIPPAIPVPPVDPADEPEPPKPAKKKAGKPSSDYDPPIAATADMTEPEPFEIPDDIPWPEPKAMHLAMLDAADNAGLDVDTMPLREALEGDWAYDPDALRGHLLDLADHVPPTEPPAPVPPPIRYVDIDVIADSLKEALSS